MVEKDHRKLIVLCFAIIYLVWGSTYLGIRFAIETVPPFLMGAGRFLLAGSLLYSVLVFKGVPRPAPVHWKNALVPGILLLGIGNGGVNWAEQRMPSSIAALIIAGTPLWFALLDWVRPGGTRPAFQTILGIVIGFCGVALLVTAKGGAGEARFDPAAVIVVLVAGFCWALGSLHSRYTPKPDAPLMGIALQMISGGMILLIIGLALGEGAQFSLRQVSHHSAFAFLYLTIIGSLVAFTAYGWLLKHTSPARLSTYAYVNPVIAVFLGWGMGGEAVNARMLQAAFIILAGVVIITSRKKPILEKEGNSISTPAAAARGR
jgi:drug/metabolite transporter (DMT)-like permease